MRSGKVPQSGGSDVDYRSDDDGWRLKELPLQAQAQCLAFASSNRPMHSSLSATRYQTKRKFKSLRLQMNDFVFMNRHFYTAWCARRYITCYRLASRVPTPRWKIAICPAFEFIFVRRLYAYKFHNVIQGANARSSLRKALTSSP